MESADGGDDHASGWMQVKKKHRSNLKFSLHGWVEGLSAKQRFSKANNQLSIGQKSESSINAVQASKDCTTHDGNNATKSTSICDEDGAVEHYLDKCVVSQNNDDLDSSHLPARNTVVPQHKLLVNQESIHKDRVLPKIKWGDLDEGTLIHYGKAHNLDPVEDHFLLKSHSLSPKVIPLEETTKEVNEVSLEDVKEQITVEKVVSQSTSNPGSDIEHFKPENDETYNPSAKNVVRANNKEEMMTSANSFSDSVCSDVPFLHHIDAASSSNAALNEEYRNGECKANSDDQVDAQNVDAANLDATVESKERFRERLWCFLFENLNRAVDELYLLCELECDLEQMKEASLVLEEAASDFGELNARVEKFEKLKRSSSHGVDEGSLVMQSDHRRPHALSWEVRRMTTSPHRAEILSSSLEAFRKIQHERNREHSHNTKTLGSDFHSCHFGSRDVLKSEEHAKNDDLVSGSKELTSTATEQTGISDTSQCAIKEKKNFDSGKLCSVVSRLPQKEGRANVERHVSEAAKLVHKKSKISAEHTAERNMKSADLHLKRNIPFPEREKRNGTSGKSVDAWKERRNWEDILASPHRVSSRFSYSPSMSRKSAERGRVLHDKLMSPEKKKKSALDLKKEAEEKHSRATRIRAQLEHERVQRLQRTSEKLNRVNEWQTVRSNKLRETMFARHQRGESRHEAYIAQVVRRAGDESSKVNEVRFITSLNEENKKLILRKKLQDSELRRAEKLQIIKIKQKEDIAREEAVLERKRLIEAEKLQRLAETQRRKEEAQVRREEERKASSAAREAKAIEQMRRKETRAKARQEEAELLAQKLAERLRESEQRRKFYLEQIREKASMDFRDQSSPLLRRFMGKEGQARAASCSNGDDNLTNDSSFTSGTGTLNSESLQHSLKRRIKKIRQRLMSLKHEFPEPSAAVENSSLGYRTAVGTARGKIGRWLQDLQKQRQARKDGAANFGLITAEMIKFLEGRDAELQASRQAGLLDFIASALPASHSSKPEACQVTLYLLRLLKVVLVTPANKCYFLVQNLLPPIIPMLATALENYIKMAASLNIPGPTNKTSSGHLESISEIVDGFLWTVAAIIGHVSCSEFQTQMQDGLVELVIAYQIIHRLRDLFALYDRPHVEGSPFPSFILLGINLLTVLTSKFKESSSIDWDSFPSDVVQGNKLGDGKFSGPADLGFNSCESCVDGRPVEPTTSSAPTDLLDVQVGIPKDSRVEHIGSEFQAQGVMDESFKAPIEDKRECFVNEKDRNNSASTTAEQKKGNSNDLKQPATFLLSAMSETGLVCLPSMLTAVLLQANNRLSAEQSSFVLPSNFEEVATGVLKVLNNLALIDISFIQKMLAQPDLKMEFFHLMSFILSHCTSNWGSANDKIGMLLLESLSLLSYFALFHPENQAVLRWGKSPTILHKVCDLPFVFFSDPELMPILAGTLVAASYGCEQNKAVIQQELSMDMLLPSLKSCKAIKESDSPLLDDSVEPNQVGPERKAQPDASQKPSKNSLKGARQRGGGIRTLKGRSQREGKVMKLSEEMYTGSAESSSLMLHCRFPASFVQKAEQFFAAEINTSNSELF